MTATLGSIDLRASQSANTGAGTATSLAVTTPTTLTGDLLVAHIMVVGTGSPFASTPSGWTIITSYTFGSVYRHSVYYRWALPTEAASYTFDFNGSYKAAAALLALKGVDKTSPIHAYNAGRGSSSTLATPTVAVTLTQAYAIAFNSDAAATMTPPASWADAVEYYDSHTSGGSDAGVEAYGVDTISAAGTIASISFTLSASNEWNSIVVVFTPSLEAWMDVQAELAGAGNGWTSLRADVKAEVPVVVRSGIFGNAPTDRVAPPGTMSFALDNAPTNSGGLQGYYLPGHANARSGWDVGINVRWVVVWAATVRYKFQGTLVKVQPDAGKFGANRALCLVRDWMDEAANKKVRLLGLQTSKRGDELLTTLLAAMSKQPPGTSFATGQSTFPYAFDNANDESYSPLAVMQQIAMSEFGYIFMQGGTSGYRLIFESRLTRASKTTSGSSLNNEMANIVVERDRDKIKNRVKTRVHPRRVDAAATSVLYTLRSTPQVAAGDTLTFSAGYSDPAQLAARVGGTAMVSPVATTDYTMNSAADGSGTNQTANWSVTATYGANSVEFVVTNGGSVAGYVTKLQCRGKGIYDYEPVVADVTDATSKTAYGENVLEVNMPLEGTPATGVDAANYLLNITKDARTTVKTVEFSAYGNLDLVYDFVSRDLGDRADLIEDGVDVDGSYFINAVEYSVRSNGWVDVKWTVSEFDILTYWILEDAVAGLLGTTTRLGF